MSTCTYDSGVNYLPLVRNRNGQVHQVGPAEIPRGCCPGASLLRVHHEQPALLHRPARSGVPLVCTWHSREPLADRSLCCCLGWCWRGFRLRCHQAGQAFGTVPGYRLRAGAPQLPVVQDSCRDRDDRSGRSPQPIAARVLHWGRVQGRSNGPAAVRFSLWKPVRVQLLRRLKPGRPWSYVSIRPW